MLVLGLVLIVAAVAVGAGAVFDGSEAASVELLGTTVDTTVAGVFFAGAVTMLLFMLGVLMLVASMGRSRRRRTERKEAKRRQRDSVQALEEERAQLRAENERLNGKLGDSRAPADSTMDGHPDRTMVDGDRTETTDDASHHSAPLREGDGSTSTGRDDASDVDLREQQRSTTGRDTTRT